MPISIDAYLKAQGFSAHPFATTNAEREVAVLPSFFIRVAWFDWLVGNPAQPESVILFAPQGYGKTSHRLEVARRVGQRRRAPALVVTINDFSPLVHPSIEQVSLDSYLMMIRRATIEALDAHLALASPHHAQQQWDARTAAYFHALLLLFAPRRAIGRPAPPDADAYVEALRSEVIGPKEWLKELARLAGALGFASVYCLVDGVDELSETRGSPARMFRLLSPLLDAPGLLQECGFAFKFFLPQDIEVEMQQQRIGRLDRIPHRVLTWSEAQLLAMLSQRLISFNRSSGTSPLTRVRTFQDLCCADFDVDRYLAQTAAHSPRTLIDLARLILEEHCQRATDPEALIDTEAIQAGVQRGIVYTAPATPPATLAAPQPHLAPAVPLLFMDERGDIWVGERRIESKLPGLMRRCFEYLWNQRHQRVGYQELLDELYGSSLEQRGDPRSSLEKLIRRLRETLEPGRPSSQRYIETQTGSGYVLRNFRDEDPTSVYV
jgi:hypothetical protein